MLTHYAHTNLVEYLKSPATLEKLKNRLSGNESTRRVLWALSELLDDERERELVNHRICEIVHGTCVYCGSEE